MQTKTTVLRFVGIFADLRGGMKEQKMIAGFASREQSDFGPLLWGKNASSKVSLRHLATHKGENSKSCCVTLCKPA